MVPATWPEKQEHLTVWERSSMWFRLQQRWVAITSQVPCFTGTVGVGGCKEAEARRVHSQARQSASSQPPVFQVCVALSRILFWNPLTSVCSSTGFRLYLLCLGNLLRALQTLGTRRVLSLPQAVTADSTGLRFSSPLSPGWRPERGTEASSGAV